MNSFIWWLCKKIYVSIDVIFLGCENVGDFFHPHEAISNDRIYGNLGAVNAESTGRAAFRFEDNVIKLSSIIGRSLVLSEGNSKNKLVCGIIARSSGLFQNPKTICACDGVSIWDERSTPKSGL